MKDGDTFVSTIGIGMEWVDIGQLSLALFIFAFYRIVFVIADKRVNWVERMVDNFRLRAGGRSIVCRNSRDAQGDGEDREENHDNKLHSAWIETSVSRIGSERQLIINASNQCEAVILILHLCLHLSFDHLRENVQNPNRKQTKPYSKYWILCESWMMKVANRNKFISVNRCFVRSVHWLIQTRYIMTSNECDWHSSSETMRYQIETIRFYNRKIIGKMLV